MGRRHPYDKQDGIYRACILSLAGIVLLLLLTGCATKFGIDNTASGGGTWGWQSWRCDPIEDPIGGNTGTAPNSTTRGGNAGAGIP